MLNCQLLMATTAAMMGALGAGMVACGWTFNHPSFDRPAEWCREDDAKEFITNVVKPRLRSQIVGSVMPTEMTRPKSYSYHSFILEGYVQLAMMAEKVGVNLWDVGADTGNSMLVRPLRCMLRAACSVSLWMPCTCGIQRSESFTPAELGLCCACWDVHHEVSTQRSRWGVLFDHGCTAALTQQPSSVHLTRVDLHVPFAHQQC